MAVFLAPDFLQATPTEVARCRARPRFLPPGTTARIEIRARLGMGEPHPLAGSSSRRGPGDGTAHSTEDELASAGQEQAHDRAQQDGRRLEPASPAAHFTRNVRRGACAFRGREERRRVRRAHPLAGFVHTHQEPRIHPGEAWCSPGIAGTSSPEPQPLRRPVQQEHLEARQDKAGRGSSIADVRPGDHDLGKRTGKTSGESARNPNQACRSGDALWTTLAPHAETTLCDRGSALRLRAVRCFSLRPISMGCGHPGSVGQEPDSSQPNTSPARRGASTATRDEAKSPTVLRSSVARRTLATGRDVAER